MGNSSNNPKNSGSRKTDFLNLNGKLVQPSQPFQAWVSELIGREEEIKKIQAAWLSVSDRLPLAPLLVGDPGVGKNRVVYEMARLYRKDLYTWQATDDATAEDLVCTVRFSDDPRKKMDYILSPLATAMALGQIYFMDGIAKLRRKAHALLESVLDERQYIESNLLGERIHARPGFRFIAATNESDLECNPLPDYIHSRIKPVIFFDYPSRDTVNEILVAHMSDFRKDSTILLDCFWRLWRENGNGKPPSPRDALKIMGYALNMDTLDKVGHLRPAPLKCNRPSSSVTAKHIERSFEVFFHTRTQGTQKCHLPL